MVELNTKHCYTTKFRCQCVRKFKHSTAVRFTWRVWMRPACGSFKVPTGGAVSCMSRFCAANIPSPSPPLGHHCYRRHHKNTWQHCCTGKKGKQVTPSTVLSPQFLPLQEKRNSVRDKDDTSWNWEMVKDRIYTARFWKLQRREDKKRWRAILELWKRDGTTIIATK